MLLDKILLLLVVQNVAVHFETSLALCQGLHLTTVLGEGSERNGGRLMDWQECIFGGVVLSLLQVVRYSAVGAARQKLG